MIKLIRGDCLAVLPKLRSMKIDAVVTDPPYGIGLKTDYTRFTNGEMNWTKNGRFKTIVGDDRPFDPSPWLQYPKVVMWGANFYSDRLPGGGWLVWQKKRENSLGKFFGDCEVAWTKNSKAVYLFHHTWAGLLRDSECGKTLHPTQKPVALMRWCIERLRLKPGSTILDPYMGSGPVGIAAVQLGFNYVGIEIDEEYFETAKRRIRSAQKAVAA